MKCEEAAELASALFDGEIVSREAAAHFADCGKCRERLNDYGRMGPELRRLAMSNDSEPVATGEWREVKSQSTSLWSKWKSGVKIPRLALAAMVLAIFALSGGLALVRAGMDRPAMVITAKLPTSDKVMHCAFGTKAAKGVPEGCGFVSYLDGGSLRASIRFIQKVDERVRLSIKVGFDRAEPNSSTQTTALGDMAETAQEYWLEPDKVLRITVPGTGVMEISGEFLDHMPAIPLLPKETFDAGPDEFRIVSPVLIKGDRMLANLDGASAVENGSKSGIEFYVPREGRFIFSPSAFEGASEVTLEANQASFTVEQRYLLVTGAPISRAARLWVLRQPDWRPSQHGRERSDDRESLGGIPDVEKFLQAEVH